VTYTITQNECNATISSSLYGTFDGTVEGSVLSGSVTFPDEGGNITANFTFTRDGDNLSGTADWTWTGDSGSCGGTTDISGMLSPEPTNCNNISGIWTIYESSDFTECPGGGISAAEYEYEIDQTGCNIVIVNYDGNATGTVDGRNITFQGTYIPFDGVIVTEVFTGTYDGGDSLSGTSVYTVSDSATGDFICTGTSTYFGTHITSTATAFGTRTAIIKKFPFPDVNR
jgi:hypothetical protein